MVSNELYLDFQRKEIKSIAVTQYDKDGRTFLCHFSNNGEPFSLKGLAVTVKMIKPDGKPVVNNCVVNDDDTATLLFTEQMCVCAGDCRLQFMIYDKNAIVHTIAMNVRIYDSVFSNDTVTSTYEFEAFNDAMQKAQSLVTGVKGSAETSYRSGNVNMSLIDLGYELAVDNDVHKIFNK